MNRMNNQQGMRYPTNNNPSNFSSRPPVNSSLDDFQKTPFKGGKEAGASLPRLMLALHAASTMVNETTQGHKFKIREVLTWGARSDLPVPQHLILGPPRTASAASSIKQRFVDQTAETMRA